MLTVNDIQREGRQAVDGNMNDQQNKRISGYRKKAETIRGGESYPHRTGLFREHWRTIAMLLIIYDAVVVNLSYLAALWLRFDLHFSAISKNYLNAWARFTPFYTIFCLVVFWGLKLYKSIWKYASYTELLYILQATIVTGTFHSVFITLFIKRMPISYYIIGIMLQFLFMVGIRFSYRIVLLLRNERRKAETFGRVMVIGAGNAGQAILRDIRRSGEVHDKVFCVIDDNPNKWGRYIEGVPVVGGRDQILERHCGTEKR